MYSWELFGLALQGSGNVHGARRAFQMGLQVNPNNRELAVLLASAVIAAEEQEREAKRRLSGDEASSSSSLPESPHTSEAAGDFAVGGAFHRSASHERPPQRAWDGRGDNLSHSLSPRKPVLMGRTSSMPGLVERSASEPQATAGDEAVHAAAALEAGRWRDAYRSYSACLAAAERGDGSAADALPDAGAPAPPSDPSLPALYLGRGTAALWLRRFVEAGEDALQAAARAADAAQRERALALAARAEACRGRWRAALDVCEAARERGASSALRSAGLDVALARDACAAAERALQGLPQEREPAAAAASSAAANGRTASPAKRRRSPRSTQAVELARAACAALSPAPEPAQALLVEALLGAGRTAEALARCLELTADGRADAPAALALRGRCLYACGDLEQAARCLEAALEGLDGADEAGGEAGGEGHLTNSTTTTTTTTTKKNTGVDASADLGQAAGDEDAARQAPATPGARARATLGLLRSVLRLKQRGNAAFGEQRWKEAHDSYSAALAADPGLRCAETARISCNRSAAAAQLGRWPEALADAEAALAVDGAYSKARARRAVALRALGRAGEALAEWERLRAADPGYPGISSLVEEARAAARAEGAGAARGAGETRRHRTPAPPPLKRRSISPESRSPPARRGDDLYALLGVARDAAPGEVRRAYRRAALRAHPDKAADAAARPRFERRFRLLAAAYAVLHDPVKRARYDAGWTLEEIERGWTDARPEDAAAVDVAASPAPPGRLAAQEILAAAFRERDYGFGSEYGPGSGRGSRFGPSTAQATAYGAAAPPQPFGYAPPGARAPAWPGPAGPQLWSKW